MNKEFFKDIDYIDIGCSKGDSLNQLQQIYPLKKGVGVDISEAKIKIAKERGYEAHVMDIFNIEDKNVVNFSTMYHMLEHLTPDLSSYDFIKKSVEISKDFLFIRQPYFDADKILEKHGLKFFWSDWIGHKNHMLYRDFLEIFSKLKNEGMIVDYTIYGNMPITNSNSDALIPLNTPVDQFEYDKLKHGDKPLIKFNFFAFREIMAFVQIKTNIDNSYKKLLASCPQSYIIDF